jgi:predicted HTH transcriptional regulator
MTTIIKQSTMQRVLAVIRDDPGVSCQHIQEQLGDVAGKQISHALAGLRRRDKIQNLGKQSRGASWYPKG